MRFYKMRTYNEAVREAARRLVHMEQHPFFKESEREAVFATIAGAIADVYERDEDAVCGALRRWIHIFKATFDEWYQQLLTDNRLE